MMKPPKDLMRSSAKTQFVLDVPYYSQRLDVKDSYWKPRACGIVALKMAMDFLNKDSESIQNLIRDGVAMGAYHDSFAYIYDAEVLKILKIQGLGWIHDGLVRLAKKKGFKKSYRKEYKKSDEKNAARSIARSIQNGASILASLKIGGSGHLVVLVGIKLAAHNKLKGFYYHDPDAKRRNKGANQFISMENFLKLWKRRIIVVHK